MKLEKVEALRGEGMSTPPALRTSTNLSAFLDVLRAALSDYPGRHIAQPARRAR